MTLLRIGTCSWKYDDWRGLVYPVSGSLHYLLEYSRRYATVEVDQWFWSLFAGDTVLLPKPEVVKEYAGSVPDDFLFAIKVPNSITLTHHYRKGNGPLQPNPYFLSVSLMERFLQTIAPLGKKIGPLLFQFEYLNRQKMSGLPEFVDRFGAFAEQLPHGYTYCLEIRNRNYLHVPYFDFLTDTGICNVFSHGSYLPPIFEVYGEFREKIHDLCVIRLLGSDRKGIERQTGKDWSRIASPHDDDIAKLASMLADLRSRQVLTFLYVNNHFEGSAPRTITRIEAALEQSR